MSIASLHRVWPALVLALVSVISGGLLAAVVAHAPTQAATWASAYLVLVVGVGTGGLATGRGLLSRAEPSPRRLAVELGAWVAGNTAVLLGTLTSPAWLVEVGSLALMVTLGSVLMGVRRGRGPRWVRGLFMTLVVILLLSIPVGVALSQLRR